MNAPRKPPKTARPAAAQGQGPKASSLLILAFGVTALFGAAALTGRFGEASWLQALGAAGLLFGGVGVLNVIVFRRLKRAVDGLARRETQD